MFGLIVAGGDFPLPSCTNAMAYRGSSRNVVGSTSERTMGSA